MIAISLWQPWASALFAPLQNPVPLRVKMFETRSWELPAKYIFVEVAIHAAKRDTIDEQAFWMDVVLSHDEMRETYGKAFGALGIEKYSDLPRGAIIGHVVFGAPWKSELVRPSEIEAEWGNFWPGRWAWPTLEVQPQKPVPCVGRQGFFNV